MTMQSLTKRTRLTVAALALALGCNGSTEPAPPVQETTGLLGNGVFRWDCVSAADPTCGTGVFPLAVALGSRFDLVFVGDGDLPDELGSIVLEAVSPTRLPYATGGFEASLAGDVSVVAFGSGYVVDYVTLDVRPVDDFLLGEPEEEVDPDETCEDLDSDDVCDGTGGVESDPPVSLVVGEVTTVRVRPFGGGADLAGALDYTWESLAPEVVSVASWTGQRSARLTVLGLGVARISVSAGGYAEVFEIEVQDAPPEPGTSTEGDTEGATSDTGTSDDSGTSGSGSESDSGSESGSESGSGSETGGTTTTTGGV